ncbi:MAG: HD domain-containing protein [Nitrospiraceae bacterium]|nr:HD domain-containing protein [Nitrospiraceae bacterium]
MEKAISRRAEPKRKKNNNGDYHQGLVEAVLRNERASVYIEMADMYLRLLGYTEHGLRHVNNVSASAYKILKKLAFSDKEAGLAAVAGLIHDVGNMLGRHDHHRTGAILAKEILEELGYGIRDTGTVMMAIMTHEESEGVVPSPVAAALLIADKADVHRSRVRKINDIKGDIHDRVNYAVAESELNVDPSERVISLNLVIDTRISHVIEYFEIFLSRMKGCREAARSMNAEFQLFINNIRMA